MRIVQTAVYKYSELSAAAQESARQWFRETSAGDCFFAESVIADAVECAAILGIDIATSETKLRNGKTRNDPRVSWSGFASQGDGASFVGRYSHSKAAAQRIRAHAPEDKVLHSIADRLQRVQSRFFYGITAAIESGNSHYCHAYTMRICAEHDTRELSAADESAIAECLRDFATWIYRNLESEYEYTNSDESVAENIDANEYEFTAAGRRV